MIRDARRLFLHKGAWWKFKGYAYSQLHKMSGHVREGKRVSLLQGATGSGKGTVAASLLADCADKGKQALLQILFTIHKGELVKLAEEEIGEAEKAK